MTIEYSTIVYDFENKTWISFFSDDLINEKQLAKIKKIKVGNFYYSSCFGGNKSNFLILSITKEKYKSHKKHLFKIKMFSLENLTTKSISDINQLNLIEKLEQ